MKFRRILLTLAGAAMLPALGSAVEPMWLRDVAISPDGSQILFTYKGDIWRVNANGGEAVRMTTMPSYEANPIWSPDGKSIAFSSDRHGNLDVFVMPTAGGRATRLTSNSVNEIPQSFDPQGKEVYFTASIQDPASSALFPVATMTELYAVPVGGGAYRQVLATPAEKMSWGSNKAADGWFLYQDKKGGEDEWRKHHTSSITRDIWRYDAKTGKHTNLTRRPGEDRDPIVAGDKVYYLSERDGGSMNVYEAPLSDLNKVTAVTSFKDHPVRFLTRGANGLLCYAYDGSIYTQKPGQKPTKVNINVIEDLDPENQKLTATMGASEATPSPDGKSVAFIYRGDVYVTATDYPTTKQISATPEAESGVTWSKDGKTLYYASQRDGVRNIYKAELGPSDPNFANATVVKETRLFKNDGVDRMDPTVSPDGKQLAFIVDRNKLNVMDLKSGKVRQLTDGSTERSRTGGFYYTWSPDSKWIALEIQDRKHSPYSDAAILNVETGKITNLSNSGYFSSSPKWVLDGNAVIYATDKYGMRNHASWGSMEDVMIVFLNQDAYDRFTLNEEDYALLKDAEKKDKKKDTVQAAADKLTGKKDAKDAKKEDKKESAEKKDETKLISVDLSRLDERTMRLTPMSTSLSDAYMTPDGDYLYYIMRAPNGSQLWKIALRKDNEHKMVSSAAGGFRFIPSGDGKTVFIAGSSMKKFDPKGDKMTPVTFKAEMELDPAAERLFMFDYVTREEGERFYNKGMHGVDWPKLTAHYRKFMPHIANNYDFQELLSEMLGELNVSHTGGRYSHRSGNNADRTASLGLLYDMKYTGDGLKVDEVVEGSPFDKAKSDMAKGMIVKAINGKELKAGQDWTPILNDIAGKKVLVSFYDPATKKSYDEVMKPISAAAMNNLLYNRWVKNRAADVDKWSNGRLGYVHIRSMGDPSFRELYSDALGKYNDRDGIVIDIRNNGGGRLHEDIEVMFTGEKYLTQEIRGEDICDMPSRRWNKPSIMVMNEACYSNAHGTPWVYKHKGIGKLVGAPVPGTMTSVNWVTMQDPTMVFGIPAVGYRTAEGTYLENSQLNPDIEVYNSPETIVLGEDTQLRTAVEALMKEVTAKK